MMKAGRYYVGDLCYVLHDSWDDFCNLTIKDHACLEGEFNLPDGRRFATFNTKWGDGSYQDQQGRYYGVDAGLIGCILMSDIDNTDDDFVTGGQVIDFVEDFDVWSEDGVIVFGNVKIDTDPQYSEHEDDYEDAEY